jgi:hypothetical protein
VGHMGHQENLRSPELFLLAGTQPGCWDLDDIGKDCGPRFWRHDSLLGLPLALSHWVSLREADEVSSDDGPGCVLDWLISSVVSLAEEGRVSVVRCAVVELGKGGAICVESCSDCT